MVLERKKKVLLNRTFVIGCGKLGAAIANERAKKGKNVVVVDNSDTSFLYLSKDFSGETVLCDAMDIKTLKKHGLPNASEVIITTGDDNTNIFLCYAISKLCSPKIEIFVRLDDKERGVLLKDLNVNTIYPLQLSFDKYRLYQGNEETK